MAPYANTLLFILLSATLSATAQPSRAVDSSGIADCHATLTGKQLVLENNCISRTFSWNDGALISLSMTDKSTGYTYPLNGKIPDCHFPGSAAPTAATLATAIIPANASTPAFLAATITVKLGTLELRKVYRIYPDCPAIACDLYLRGTTDSLWTSPTAQPGELRNIENTAAMADGQSPVTILETLALTGKHWQLNAVEFADITDRTDNLVKEDHQLLYRSRARLTGNLLLANDITSRHGIFILKEAPCSNVQLAYPGFDFSAAAGSVQCVGIGITPHDLHPTEWTRCYGFVTGVAGAGETGGLKALRTYQQKIRQHIPRRDDMVLMNTWGDRNQDRAVRETFILRELEAAAKLGITHYQIDDGWQTGRSSNSALPGGSLLSIWDRPDYWTPDPVKFPEGFTNVVALARQLHIEPGIWFNPSQDSSYAHWKEDAGVLIGLYKKYGIRTFKIDGVQIKDKQSEVNFRKMLDTVMEQTNRSAVFNLDVTAGRRNGYHYFNEYGNIFLENRYTDWGNYYPYRTLRNLWQLSRYVPAQNLQVEFLNNTRNKDKYDSNDAFAPSHYSLSYEFATTMMAQPLAWMEATGLPPNTAALSQLIRAYTSIQSDLHAGQIFPIGNEPDGTSWTGFQSIGKDKGYLLIIRENSPATRASITTYLPPFQKITLVKVLGEGPAIHTKTDAHGNILFTVPKTNSFCLYHYVLQ